MNNYKSGIITRYNGNIVESGVKHHKPKPLYILIVVHFLVVFCYLRKFEIASNKRGVLWWEWPHIKEVTTPTCNSQHIDVHNCIK